MSPQEYDKVLLMYQDLIDACPGMPQQQNTIREAQFAFISNAFIQPAYTMKASWLMSRGQCIEMDMVIQMHPYDFCIAHNQITKDYNKSLDLLRKYIHERIDMLFN